MIGAVLALMAAALVGGGPAAAQPGSELTVYLLTFDPGGRVWERYGHNAIWIRDTLRDTDSTYDYGRFDFKEANFALKFARGEMRYGMGAGTADDYIRAYTDAGRQVWVQELDLAPAARLRLRDFLERNLLDPYYAYDYYRDNCSTRIRDALDTALGGALRRYGEAPSGMTFREETRRLNQHKPLLYLGLMIGLGQPTDREMTRWEQMFVPMRLREALDSLRVAGPGGPLPVVRSERILYPSDRYPVPERPHDWTLEFLAAGLGLGGILAGLGVARAAAARVGFLLLGTLWALLTGVGGLVLTLLWAATGHEAAYRNENLLLLNILALTLAVVLPRGLRSGGAAGNAARRLAQLVAALAALGLVLKLLPWFDQANLDLIALILPVHAGLAYGVARRVSSLRSS